LTERTGTIERYQWVFVGPTVSVAFDISVGGCVVGTGSLSAKPREITCGLRRAGTSIRALKAVVVGNWDSPAVGVAGWRMSGQAEPDLWRAFGSSEKRR
jgi:hypothetical protein